MVIVILFPLETVLIHVRVVFVGYVKGYFGEDTVPSHFVRSTGAVAKPKKKHRTVMTQVLCEVNILQKLGTSPSILSKYVLLRFVIG